MEKLFTRKEAAKILGISIATLDTARNNGLISYVQCMTKKQRRWSRLATHGSIGNRQQWQNTVKNGC